MNIKWLIKVFTFRSDLPIHYAVAIAFWLSMYSAIGVTVLLVR